VAVPEEDWPTDPSQRRVIMADFDVKGDYGDRRQVRNNGDDGWVIGGEREEGGKGAVGDRRQVSWGLGRWGYCREIMPRDIPSCSATPNLAPLAPHLHPHSQEIVFIGAAMDRAAIEEQLDSALLTEAGGLVGGRAGRQAGRVRERVHQWSGMAQMASESWDALLLPHCHHRVGFWW